MKNVAWKLVPGIFYFSWNPLLKEIGGGQDPGLYKFE